VVLKCTAVKTESQNYSYMAEFHNVVCSFMLAK